jgi:PAS domain S-box-containing protein
MNQRALFFYWICAAIIILIAATGAWTMAARDQENRIASAYQDAETLAMAMAEHTTQIFERLDALSRGVIRDRNTASASTLSDLLERRAMTETVAQAVAIVDRSGRVTATSTDILPIGKDVSGTAAFRFHSSSVVNQAYIGQAYQVRFDRDGAWNGWTLDFTRRVDTEDGAFAGFVLIVVNGPSLYGFYDRLSLESGDTVGLIGEDGVIRASNIPAVIGYNIGPFVEKQLNEGGGFQVSPSLTGGEFAYGYSKSSAARLLAYVGTPTGPIYADWRSASLPLVVALLGLGAALTIAGIVLGKYLRSRGDLQGSVLETAQERRERKFLEAILHTAGALVVVTDATGRPIMANPAFCALFEVAELPANATVLEHALDKSIGEVIADLPNKSVVNLHDRRGRRREVSWTLTAIRDEAGAINHLIAIGFDNTERREAELAVYQAGKLVTLGEMATGLAHEINQPLGTIALTVDVLQTRMKAGTAEQDFIETKLAMIGQQVERTSAIVDHMRVFGRMSDGTTYPFDPAEAVEGALAIAEIQLDQAGIRLHRHYTAGAHRIVADLIQVEQIVLNIVLNARDAIITKRDAASSADPADDRIDISLEERSAEGFISIVVSDTGSGIDPAILDRLFDPFFTTKPVGMGTGLGLSLSYGIARDLGGGIEVRNTATGAEFTILLPCADRQTKQENPAGRDAPISVDQPQT